MSLNPFDIMQAREASRYASAQQKGCETAMREASAKLASCERAYRLELAKTITKLHAEGVAWTACEQLAKGVLEAVSQQAFRHGSDRRDLHVLLTWSMRRDLAEGYGDVPEPKDMPTIGGRRAA